MVLQSEFLKGGKIMEYITAAGDTFDTIAHQIYGNAEMVKPIIEANPDFSDVVVFDYGVTITVPDKDETDDSASLPPWRR